MLDGLLFLALALQELAAYERYRSCDKGDARNGKPEGQQGVAGFGKMLGVAACCDSAALVAVGWLPGWLVSGAGLGSASGSWVHLPKSVMEPASASPSFHFMVQLSSVYQPSNVQPSDGSCALAV